MNKPTDGMEAALLERSPVEQPFGSFPAFYRTKKFTTALTTSHHLSLP
jgi:hypothetical protein